MMQEVCQPHPHNKTALCHKQVDQHKNNCTLNGRSGSDHALILCTATMDVNISEDFVVAYQFIAACLKSLCLRGGQLI